MKYVHFDQGVQELAEDFTEALFLAAKDSIPMSKGGGVKKHSRFWNDDCDNAVKYRDKMKRKVRNKFDMASFVEYKRSKAVATKVIKKAKRSSWRSFCSSLSYKTKLGKVWKVIKGINSVNKSQGIPHLKTDDGFTEDNIGKANVLVNHFAKVSSTNNYSDEFKAHKMTFEEGNANCLDF